LTDQSDFAEFYAATFGPLTVQLQAFTGDPNEAQDLVQEAFCRAYARWERLAAYDDPAGWVRRVAWNMAVSRWRRLKRLMHFRHDLATAPVSAPNGIRVDLVRALGALSARHRQAVVLHYFGGLSISEIAAQVDVAEGTVKSWLHRAKAALATQLADTDVGAQGAPNPPGVAAVQRTVSRRKAVRTALYTLVITLLIASVLFTAGNIGTPTVRPSMTSTPAVSATPTRPTDSPAPTGAAGAPAPSTSNKLTLSESECQTWVLMGANSAPDGGFDVGTGNLEYWRVSPCADARIFVFWATYVRSGDHLVRQDYGMQYVTRQNPMVHMKFDRPPNVCGGDAWFIVQGTTVPASLPPTVVDYQTQRDYWPTIGDSRVDDSYMTTYCPSATPS
jgi:RNA polymerase sigma-70 factor, ECF subfamily